MITLDRLRYFVEVALTEHVGEAAKILGVSPSVVSAAIKDLEEEFNCQLFERVKQRIRLSERGEILLEKARGILNETQQLHDQVSTGDFKLRGHYRIGASHFLMQEYLVPAFLEIQKSHPGITVEFVSLDTGLAISRLLKGELDAALVFKSSNYHELDEIVLYEGQFQIVVKKNHPILKKNGKQLSIQLNELPAITFRTSIGPNFWESHPAFNDVGIKPKHTYFYEDTQTALQLLNSTQGWAFLPDKVISKYQKIQKITFSKELKAPIKISFIKKKGHHVNALTERLLDLLVKRISEF
ncbi:MAG: LysR family transcriptional regulator [Bacteriovoracaceae bacterium]|nr:LysR family transcriptional regulator [Bacteriovoracaceae bacterium]